MPDHAADEATAETTSDNLHLEDAPIDQSPDEAPEEASSSSNESSSAEDDDASSYAERTISRSRDIEIEAFRQGIAKLTEYVNAVNLKIDGYVAGLREELHQCLELPRQLNISLPIADPP